MRFEVARFLMTLMPTVFRPNESPSMIMKTYSAQETIMVALYGKNGKISIAMIDL